MVAACVLLLSLLCDYCYKIIVIDYVDEVGSWWLTRVV